ncbi:MAG: Ig-like domain-containing protein, partial [Alphaproteobacteria bacterium]|nr:Ig-like domain-containing protein [Alphaproteobacteria bacterium]
MSSKPQIFTTWLGIILALLAAAGRLCAQTTTTFHYFYDDLGQLTKVIDSSGNEIDYIYDQVGNLVQIKRGTAPASNTLAILNFTPQSGGAGTTVTIQGQGFDPTAANDAVKFNGVPATLLSATTSTLVVTVPAAATTGLISLTVAGTTVNSGANFTFIPVPAILSISPKFFVSSASAINVSNFQVTGANLAGATFAFAPALSPPAIAVSSATIDSTGTSATLGLTIAPNAVGSFTLIATNTAGSSSQLSTANNTLSILDPNGDADGDGLTNAVEIAIGTNPLNATTSGAGLPDGWQVFYGFNPLDPSVAGQDLDGSGLTVLQDFQQGLSPRNPNRVPPSVSQIFPANGATNIFINDVIVARFAEPLQIGTSLFAAQSAIMAALGSSSNLTSAQQQTAALTLQGYMNRTCCGNSVVPGAVTVTGPHGAVGGTVAASSDGLSVTFAPSQPMAANTTYTITIQGLRDSAGNLMTKAFQSSFTTGSSLDNTAPTIVRVDPANNATNVPTNVRYTVQFSKAIDPSTLTTTTFSVVDNTANAPITGTIQVDSTNMTAYFVPNQLLPPDRSFTVTLTTGVKDFAGHGLASNSSFTFTTGASADTDKPHLVSTSPLNRATGIPANSLIDLLFNEPLDVATLAPNIQVLAAGSPIPISIATSYGDERVTITPVQGLQASTQYTVTIGSGIADLGGNLIDNPG